MKRYAIILAGGKGARMRSSRTDFCKSALPILGKPMILYVLDAVKALKPDQIATIVGSGGDTIKALVEDQSEIIWPKEQKGTAHAVMSAKELLGDKEGTTIICRGDTPLLTDKTLEALISSHITNQNDLTLLSASFDDPRGYARIIKEQGRVLKIVNQKDCSLEEEAIHEINTGIYAFNNKVLFENIAKFAPNGEYQLTDLINALLKSNAKVGCFALTDRREAMDVNDRYVLSKAEKAMRERINKRLMLSGVTISDPDTAYIGPDVVIGNDTVILPNTTILGNSKIGNANSIGPNTYLNNAAVGNENRITFSHIEDCKIGSKNELGPYLRMRNGCVVGDQVLLGNFNELKNVRIGRTSRASHLSYLGDVQIGEDVNIGCGTIVANFDGVNKFESKIEDGAFIGSGSIIISPITVGKDAFIAAGSTINKDVEPGDMAIARARQENKPGYAETLKKKAKAKSK